MSNEAKKIAFIDGSNLFWSIREISRVKNTPDYRLDYAVLRKHVFGDQPATSRAYYYGSLPDDASDAQLKYIQKLRHLGFKVKLFPLKRYSGQSDAKEKGVDVAIAMDMLELAYVNAYDLAVLVSHDEDFFELIERVQRLGKFVAVCGFRDRMSQKLSEAADTVIDLSPHWEELRFNGGVE